MSITLNGTLRNLDKILIVDGYSATGKKLLCLILQTLKRVEKMEMNNFVGDLTCLKLFNKISDDGYEALSKNFAQIRHYIQKQKLQLETYKNYYEPGNKGKSKSSPSTK